MHHLEHSRRTFAKEVNCSIVQHVGPTFLILCASRCNSDEGGSQCECDPARGKGYRHDLGYKNSRRGGLTEKVSLMHGIPSVQVFVLAMCLVSSRAMDGLKQ